MIDIENITKSNLQKIWNGSIKNVSQEQIKYHFGLKLYQYSAGKNFDTFIPESKRKNITSVYRSQDSKVSSKEKQFQRLLLGYQGIPVDLTPFKCGISSKEANKNKINCVKDHVIGVTLAGQIIARELDNRLGNDYSSLDKVRYQINLMCDDWLQNNLWLWATCRITRDEHSPKRLLRGSKINSGKLSMLEYKKSLLHYKEANIEIEKYNS